MAGTILLIVVLLLVAMVLIVVEICTPIFGLLALAAFACAGAAVYLAYTLGPLTGLAMLVAVLVFLPAYTVAAVRILPRTALGRRLNLGREPVQAGEAMPEKAALAELVGRTTVAETTLRPGGTIRIEGRRIVAQAESGMIEQGRAVVVVRAAGNYVVVRKSHESPAAPDAQA